jgi:hypothetical protein
MITTYYLLGALICHTLLLQWINGKSMMPIQPLLQMALALVSLAWPLLLVAYIIDLMQK